MRRFNLRSLWHTAGLGNPSAGDDAGTPSGRRAGSVVAVLSAILAAIQRRADLRLVMESTR